MTVWVGGTEGRYIWNRQLFGLRTAASTAIRRRKGWSVNIKYMEDYNMNRDELESVETTKKQPDKDGKALNVGDKVKRHDGRGGAANEEPEGTVVGFNSFGAPVVRFGEPLSFNGRSLVRVPQERWVDAGDDFRVVDAISGEKKGFRVERRVVD